MEKRLSTGFRPKKNCVRRLTKNAFRIIIKNRLQAYASVTKFFAQQLFYPLESFAGRSRLYL